MKSIARRRPRIGDVFELKTPIGFAYLQYINKHDEWGALVRVLGPVLEFRPAEFQHVVAQQERFVIFFPLGAAVAKGIVSMVAHMPLPERSNTFPLFKAPGNIEGGKVLDWWLWDGNSSWRVAELSADQYDLPTQQVVNDTMLIDLILNNWRPRDHVESLKIGSGE